MFPDLKYNELFKRTGDYALEYAEDALRRNVFPDENALKNLVFFDEELPFDSVETLSILDQLQLKVSEVMVGDSNYYLLRSSFANAFKRFSISL